MLTLNLITPLLRPELIETVWASIPDKEDIHWIIVKQRDVNIPYLPSDFMNITILNVDKEGLDQVHLKMAKAYEHCKEGYFQGIDDDTEFNFDTYRIFRKAIISPFKMVVGKQVIWFEDKFVTRCEAQEPEPGKVDGAQALIHTDIIKTIKIKDLSKDPCADGNFLKECWEFCKSEERIIINEVISKYNTLR